MSLSYKFLQAAFAPQSSQFAIGLVTIDHDQLEAPIRLSTDNTQRLVVTALDIVYGTRHNGNDFYFFPCTLKLPDDTDDGPNQMRLQFDHVTRQYTDIIRSIVGKPTVNVDLLMSDNLDWVELSWPEFRLTHIDYDAGTVTLEMEMETLTQESYPGGAYTTGGFPAMYRTL